MKNRLLPKGQSVTTITSDPKTPLKSHYAFNVNKLQETKSSLSLLMGSLQSHLHIDVLLIRNCGCFAKFERVKNSKITTQDSSCTAHCFEIQIMHSVGRAWKDTLCQM